MPGIPGIPEGPGTPVPAETQNDPGKFQKLGNLYVVANSSGLWYSVTVFTQALQVQLDGLPDSFFRLFDCRAGSNASW